MRPSDLKVALLVGPGETDLEELASSGPDMFIAGVQRSLQNLCACPNSHAHLLSGD